ncbi:hypothetical protein BJ875DRAFT_294410 [Amylocarpus encephaloides]|uniref:Uncharacterized protein n=1 Tax=Amylocarpus encephaloides TaxID=45428 RepID=A0A9P7YJ53_9HELO|nr:hypothetical protein BJ875DRAFT_294410 [Amylocarpus encephaloides]
MSTHSDDGSNLTDSTYEFVETDVDREGNGTDSLASTDDVGRPDDVASLADTEESDEEGDGDEDAAEPATQPLTDLEHAVRAAFDTPTLGRSSAFPAEDSQRSLPQSVEYEESDGPFARSIEFEEPSNLGAGTVSVKHTVTEHNETDTASIVGNLGIEGSPHRLLVTIRQTMTKQGLTTKEPLRILYVGSHSAKRDIIHKIASTVTASVPGDKGTGRSRQSSSQLYNVVTVSGFGSEKTPEIELVHSSECQIKVEDCLSVERLEYNDASEKPVILKLTTEDGSCHSVPLGKEFTLEPHFEVPHISIFYHDRSEDMETSKNARDFMIRHGVPSIIINHQQTFLHSQSMEPNEHSVHMSLEARDSRGRKTMVPGRHPIDLNSFLNIDARQMNRNLAYLTKLYEPLQAPVVASKTPEPEVPVPEYEKTSLSLRHLIISIQNRPESGYIMPVGMLLLSLLSAIMLSFPYVLSREPTISINSKVVSNIPVSCTTSSTQAALITSATAPASISVATSTRTVTVTHAPTSGPNSLAIVPSMDLGATSQKFHSNAKANRSICSAQILGGRDILIRIPSATKLSWLTKDAMSVNISRCNDTVDTERVYSSDEGIVLSLPKKEAYGVLNITIITTRKPRVNETFQVDFGTSTLQAVQNMMDKMSSMFHDKSLLVPSLSELVDEAKRGTLNRLEETRNRASGPAVSLTDSITDLAKSVSREAAKRSAIISKEVNIRLVEAEMKVTERMRILKKLPEPLREGIFKAQVKSKLMWLRMQGKDDEYRAYEEAAKEAIRAKAQAAGKGEKQAKHKKTCGKRKAERMGKRCTKKCVKAKRAQT